MIGANDLSKHRHDLPELDESVGREQLVPESNLEGAVPAEPAKESLETSILGEAETVTVHLISTLALRFQDRGYTTGAQKLQELAEEMKNEPQSLPSSSIILNLQKLARDFSRWWLHKEAEELMRIVLDLNIKKHGQHDGITLKTMHCLASVLAKSNQYREAEDLFRETLQLQEKAARDDYLDYTVSLRGLAKVLFRQNRHQEAERVLQQAIGVYEEKKTGPNYPPKLKIIKYLALLALERHQLNEAESMIQGETAAITEIQDSNQDLALAGADILGFVYWKQGNLTRAKTMFERALAGYEDSLGPTH